MSRDELELEDERIERDGKVLRFIQDTDCESPRSYDGRYGTFVDWHRRDNVGDRKLESYEEEALQRGGMSLLKRYLRRFYDVAVILPVGLLDHSGWHIYVGGGDHWADPGGWDSGTVGFIYATNKEIADMGIPAGQKEKQLESEIEELDKYFRGDCWGFVIEDEKGNHLDSCWGFIGFEFCKEEALSVFDDIEVPNPFTEAGLEEVQ